MPFTTLPLITIGITCYNAEDTIGRCVRSAVAQVWPNREIVVVDDCSTDASWAVIQELVKEFPEIRAIRHEGNRGYPGALNTIIEAARGKYIAFFDDDDESVPRRLEHQQKRLSAFEAEKPGAVVFCYSNRNVVTTSGPTACPVRLGIGRVSPEPHGPIVADYVLGLIKDDRRYCWGMFGSCTLMARAENFRQLGTFDVHFRRCAELDFAVRAALKGAYFISVDSPLVTQFMTNTEDKSGMTDLNYKLLLARKYKAYLKTNRAYLGALFTVYAQFYRNRSWVWTMWYLAALLSFPMGTSLNRLKHSSLWRRWKLKIYSGSSHAPR